MLPLYVHSSSSYNIYGASRPTIFSLFGLRSSGFSILPLNTCNKDREKCLVVCSIISTTTLFIMIKKECTAEKGCSTTTTNLFCFQSLLLFHNRGSFSCIHIGRDDADKGNNRYRRNADSLTSSSKLLLFLLSSSMSPPLCFHGLWVSSSASSRRG